MKTRLHLLASALAATTVLFSGCSGGGGGQGGGGRNPNGGQDPDGMVVNPDQIDAVLHVNAKGRVLTSRGRSLPGTSVSVISEGTVISEDVTDNQGVYHVRLRRGQHNAVRATRNGFDFEPEAILINPRQPEVLRDIVGTARPMAIPGAGQQQVDDPVGAGGRPGAIQGQVAVRLMMHPDAGALDAVMRGQVVLIRNAATNRVIESRTINDSNDFAYTGSVGSEIIIEPVPSFAQVRWYPSSRRLRIGRAQQNVTFQWRVDQAPAAQPTPRPANRPVAWPSANPAPTPRPVFRPVPIATPRPTLQRPQSTPTPALRPIRYPLGQ